MSLPGGALLDEDPALRPEQVALAAVKVDLGPVLSAVLVAHVALELRRHLVADDVELLAGGHRENLHLRRPFEVVDVVEGLVDGLAAHDDTVVGVHQHLLAVHRPRDAASLVVVHDEAVEVGVVRDVAVEAQAVLVAHVQLEVGGAAQRGAPRHVGVQHRDVARLVQALVDEEGGRVRLALALHHAPRLVHQQQVARGHLRPQHAVRDDQKAVRGAGDHHC
mmetsp:Transcript_31588/g.80943  ORF Transcript_31588/g.80943 Transcript_31588/m.80943 type:complete len:221 (+) Transcript_31588:65-727(+)